MALNGFQRAMEQAADYVISGGHMPALEAVEVHHSGLGEMSPMVSGLGLSSSNGLPFNTSFQRF